LMLLEWIEYYGDIIGMYVKTIGVHCSSQFVQVTHTQRRKTSWP
jgi:hypothetical protein